jgi:hypothetical protein
MRKKIAWSKYIDPLNTNVDEVEFPGFIDDAAEGEDVPDDDMYASRPSKLLNTPYGIITITDYSLVTKQFDFWILHTNFDISEDVLEMIEMVPGVETLEPQTRYRLRVGFPKSPMWESSDIKTNIQNVVSFLDKETDESIAFEVYEAFDEEISDKVSDLRTELQSNSRYWMIYLLPNGEMEWTDSNTQDDDFVKAVAAMIRAKDMVGGIIFSHKDYE